jgi:hypothetical protein
MRPPPVYVRFSSHDIVHFISPVPMRFRRSIAQQSGCVGVAMYTYALPVVRSGSSLCAGLELAAGLLDLQYRVKNCAARCSPIPLLVPGQRI